MPAAEIERYGDWSLRRLGDADQADLLRWRNQPQVRKVMVNAAPIGEAEHAAWWRRTRDDPTRRWYTVERAGVPLAVLDYFDLDTRAGQGWWGFYLTDRAPAEGRFALWNEIESLALKHAFAGLGLRTLWCETRASNQAVLAMHEHHGFQRAGVRTLTDGDGDSLIVMRAEAPGPDPTRIDMRLAFLGSANWDLAGAAFESAWRSHTGRLARALRLPFGQYRLQLNDPDSTLRRDPPDVLVFAERLEDLLPDPHGVPGPQSEQQLATALEAYLACIEQARQAMPGHFLVLELAPLRGYPAGWVSGGAPEPVHKILDTLNRRLAECVRNLADTTVLPLGRLLAAHGGLQADPGKYWHLGRIPYSDAFTHALADHLCGILLAAQGRTVRALAVDLDGTLWHGLVGEAGVAGLQVGGDHPGSAHAGLQHLLRALLERGIVLCLCSKNDEATALQALDKHPGMLLRRRDFVAWRINWAPKPDNLRELAAELGLGLDAFGFIDDSPHEREEMRRRLPQVWVPELPAEVAEWPGLLLAHPRMALLPATAEDIGRADRYRARAAAEREAAGFETREDFLHSLGMRASIRPMNPGNRQRVLQLLAKTNQFNATTRRHGGQDLERMRETGAEVLAVASRDRLAPEEETIGVMILDCTAPRACLDSLLLSCRVLGRGLESAMLAWAAQRALRRGCKELAGEIVETPRNGPVRDLYARHGFEGSVAEGFVLDLAKTRPEVPSWIDLADS